VLVALAVDGVRAGDASASTAARRTLPPSLRGSLAILLNPGGWLFLAVVASPLLSTASQRGGVGTALAAAIALVAGAAVGDAGLVVVGGAGVRRASGNTLTWIRRSLAGVLAGAGVWLIVAGIAG
jgi:threonine/homoserine/homoserine lactone efflux protein